MRLGTGVAETRFQLLRAVAGAFLKAHGLAVEVFDQRGAVMLGDEIGDRRRQVVLFRECHPVLDMADDDQRAQRRFEQVVAVLAGLIFDEVLRFEHFADVVEVTADADEERVGADGLGRRFGQCRHGDAVRIGSRGPFDQFLQERM